MKKLIKISALIIGIIILLFILNYYILKNTAEINQHNIGTSGNSVYLHIDGHQEAVYDKDGNLVTDSINMGTYNFCNPINDPICHFMLDTYPWIKWGTSPNDSTTKKQRLIAFLKDYFDGFKRTFGLKE